MEVFDTAISLLLDMEDQRSSPGIVICNILIDSLRKVGNLEAAKEPLHTLEAKQLQPDVVTLTTLISGFFSEGKTGEFIMLLEKMKEKECSPNAATYNISIRGLSGSKAYSRAAEFFRAMH